MLKKSFSIIIAVLLTLGLSISFQSLLAAWVAPSADPPTQSIDEPLDSGVVSDRKRGGLYINLNGTGNTQLGEGGLYVASHDVYAGFVPTSIDSLVRFNQTRNMPALIIDNTGTANSLVVNDVANDTTPFVIDESGNVGIGTNGPLAKLQVIGNAIFGNNISNLTNTPLNVSLGGDYGSNPVGNSGNLKLDLYSVPGNRFGLGISNALLEYQAGVSAGHAFFVNEGTEAMRILPDGNVGIGTNAPDHDLTMSSGGTVSLNDGYLMNVKGIYMKDWDDDTGGQNVDPDANKYRLLARDGAWQFYNGGVVVGNYANDTMTDLADGNLIVEGNIGIGTTNPGSKLDVVGTINTDRIIIDNKWNLGTNAYNDDWLRIFNSAGTAEYGGLAADHLWASTNVYANRLCTTGSVCANVSSIVATPSISCTWNGWYFTAASCLFTSCGDYSADFYCASGVITQARSVCVQCIPMAVVGLY